MQFFVQFHNLMHFFLEKCVIFSGGDVYCVSLTVSVPRYCLIVCNDNWQREHVHETHQNIPRWNNFLKQWRFRWCFCWMFWSVKRSIDGSVVRWKSLYFLPAPLEFFVYSWSLFVIFLILIRTEMLWKKWLLYLISINFSTFTWFLILNGKILNSLKCSY